MTKALFMIFLVLINALPAGALEVDIDELKKTMDREIVFINYQGRHDKIETAVEIKDIGRLLATALERDGSKGQIFLKYSIIRAVDPTEEGKFDADIISIDPEAKVDHIDNVRRITAGYLEAAHGYSEADARLLAKFATIYNAVFRGDLGYFSENYKALVLSHINEQNAGISTRYFEWPGATRMLIPLSVEEKGKLSALITSELTEEKVIEEMRKQEDMGLEDRKEMVEFKDREVEEKEEEAESERKRLEDERAKLEEKKEELKKGEAISEERKALVEKERELEREERELEKKEEDIRKKEEEIARERTGIIEDERSKDRDAELVAEERKEAVMAAIFADKLYYMKVRERDAEGYTTSTLSIIDPVPETIMITSPVSHISGRNYYFYKELILVIAHERKASSPAHLVLLHPHTLEEIGRSGDAVYPRSFLSFQSGYIYAVVENRGAFHLGRFDEALKLNARSEDMVDEDSAFALFGEKLYINSPDGDILILDDMDLSRRGLIKQ